MARTSFLHSSLTQALIDTDHVHQNNVSSTESLIGMRLLLIEEEPWNDNDCGHGSAGMGSSVHPNVAFSLVMETAYSVTASSDLVCRGCHQSDKHENLSEQLSVPCRCCHVAVLVIDKNAKPNNKRKCRSHHSNNHRSKMQFPMYCRCGEVPETVTSSPMSNDPSKCWDPNLLHHIFIKYICSLSELIRYLAFAPSLADYLQPLDGIFVVGLHKLLLKERERNNTLAMMELTHTLSILSETGDILQANRRNIMKAATDKSSLSFCKSSNKGNCGQVTLVATIGRSLYTLLPNKIQGNLNQWMDYTAFIQSVKHPNLDIQCGDKSVIIISCWELMFQTLGIDGGISNVVEKLCKQSFPFKVIKSVNEHNESPCEIIWNV